MERQNSPETKEWAIVQRLHDSHASARDATLFALSNGTVGIRGSIEESHVEAASFLPDAFTRQPIPYHERFSGFAVTSDTRLRCADVTSITILIDGKVIDFDNAEIVDFERILDMRAGVLERSTRWRLADDRLIDVVTRRLVPFGGGPVVANRIEVAAVNFDTVIAIEAQLQGACVATEDANREDPRINARAADELTTIVDTQMVMVQRDQRTGLHVSAAQQIVPQSSAACRPLTAIDRFCGLAVSGDPDTAIATAKMDVAQAADAGFEALSGQHSAVLHRFWNAAALSIPDDPELARAIRFNLFHLFQSASRNDRHGIAAKGLTGEGYEGHYFWDAEVYMLPVLALTDPALARHILMYRVGMLDAARENARRLNHGRGALYPWRTIAGAECSAHYPTGAAQYHINAAIAYAVEIYWAASGDDAFIANHGAEMVFETARLWLEIGHFTDRAKGAFMIHGVTGPDEYTALVDNNFYTNAMAQRHLRLAIRVAQWCTDNMPDQWAALTSRLCFDSDEIANWQRAADAMHLPTDDKLRVSPQDDTFLTKPVFDLRAVPADHHPLLLHYHPMTLFRHQLCKQGDVIQAMVLTGDGFGLSLKARNYAYYEPLTTHDSTLSPSTFAILAAELGLHDEGLRFHRDAAFVDLEDRLHNAGHGAHLAAMAGSWLALVQGWGGLRVRNGALHLLPTLPSSWNSYLFRFTWRGSIVETEVFANATHYRLIEGPEVILYDRMQRIGVGVEGATVPRPTIDAVIFDLDGVLTNTANAHYVGWKRLCDEEGIAFDRIVNERLKGVDRQGSLAMILESAGIRVDDGTFAEMMARKNSYYLQAVEAFGPVDLFRGARELLDKCRLAGLRTALASASQNAALLIERLEIANLFDHIVDATTIKASKPNPEIYLAAASALDVSPDRCVGIEDAIAGIEAVRAAGMRAIGIGDADLLFKADCVFAEIGRVPINAILGVNEPTRQKQSINT